MFCKNCGSPVDDGAKFCKNCGGKIAEAEDVKAEEPVTEEVKVEPAAITVSEPVSSNPVKAKLEEILSGQIFLILAVLLSVSAVFSLAVGSFNVITVLFVIFTWLAFAAAKKNDLQPSHIRNVSGTFFAVEILLWVAVGLFGVLAITVLALGSSFGARFASILNQYSGTHLNIPSFAYGGAAVSVIIFVALLVVIAVIIVMNLGYITIHKFFRSLYQSLDSGVASLEKAKAASGWCLALGIISGIGALGSLGGTASSFMSFIASGSFAAVWILLYVMIKKYAAAEDK